MGKNDMVERRSNPWGKTILQWSNAQGGFSLLALQWSNVEGGPVFVERLRYHVVSGATLVKRGRWHFELDR